MIRINRINPLGNSAGPRKFVAWGKINLKPVNAKQISNNIQGNVNALIFAAVLIVCSVAVGCSSDKPKPVSSNNQIPATTPGTQVPSPVAPAPTVVAENKPAAKKIVRKKPATVNYTDKNYGVTFEYPRRYAIETGDSAADVLTSSPVPMNFVMPGGVALAAVELPETGFANTDFSSAFFDVSVHKGLTADQCSEFAVPQPKVMAVAATESAPQNANQAASPEQSATPESSSTQTASTGTEPASETPTASTTTSATASDSKTGTDSPSPAASTSSASEAQGSKLMIGDLELRATEAVSGEGTRQSDAKYFHTFQNGACYEFAVNVTTMASSDGLIKHVDRDKVFSRLEQILSTVKIDELKPAAAPETASEVPAAAPTQENPAQ